MWTLIYKRLWWGPVWKLVQLLKRIGSFLSLFSFLPFSFLRFEGGGLNTQYILFLAYVRSASVGYRSSCSHSRIQAGSPRLCSPQPMALKAILGVRFQEAGREEAQ